MTLARYTNLTLGRGSSVIATFGLALAVAGCSDGGADGDETASPSATQAADTPAASAEMPAVVGEVAIGEERFELAQSYWCEPEAGFESGTTVANRVAAYDESGDVMVYGMQVDEDGSGSSTSTISVATDPNTNYSSEGLSDAPSIVRENGAVVLRGDVYRAGQDPIALEAEFVLPPEPGFPGYC